MTITMKDLFSGMAAAFKPEAAGDLQAVIQFEVTGDEAGVHHLVIENGTCSYHEGSSESPTLTITTPDHVWRDITLGRLDGTKAFMSGKLKAKGNMGLLMKLPGLFSPPSST
jgi:putative sterol carrier protein